MSARRQLFIASYDIRCPKRLRAALRLARGSLGPGAASMPDGLMSQRRLPWMLAYDVCCPHRLARLHRRLVRTAAPVQYSVSLLHATTDEMTVLMDTLERGWMAPKDDLRAYPIGEAGSVVAVGAPRCSEPWSGWAALLQPQPDGSYGHALSRQGLLQLPDSEDKKDP